jgi:DNA-binding NtrC family response regulator
MVKATFSGEEAVEVANNEDFDVAVVDLKMPGMDGVETQKRLKKVQPFLQSIVLTGHGTIDTALESGKEDAFKYLLKPIEYDNLVETINEAYEHKPSCRMPNSKKKWKKSIARGWVPGVSKRP